MAQRGQRSDEIVRIVEKELANEFSNQLSRKFEEWMNDFSINMDNHLEEFGNKINELSDKITSLENKIFDERLKSNIDLRLGGPRLEGYGMDFGLGRFRLEGHMVREADEFTATCVEPPKGFIYLVPIQDTFETLIVDSENLLKRGENLLDKNRFIQSTLHSTPP
ncbi:hypothetical protein [Methanosarcina vacuolata]|uniref:hypothetical protein n=1 Tax=Methanosarcina vacuolata TaxID=2215 RepID=UPI00064FFC29|nr:hypothetical protein [Methanosarcina vacuolata]